MKNAPKKAHMRYGLGWQILLPNDTHRKLLLPNWIIYNIEVYIQMGML